uniref:EF-hand domain-containing protein n=1 Tax=Hemiselmis tepida TaxID=464990 RepID=A0A7S0YKT0_9CRYP|mmetsp:Transcript_13449/g.34493  ORF Transcript_13449/g.34493 Transcript_13449/m.34493 type:complete len:218 (+) Transcript_13449:14-667(+)|eukprot:CAMPEP_0174929360 /NCGR_PEP_ID=MMETSP1355-20121228/27160_1 /TAXON_ID=464990 /ORGANISM="Hemiselmis tepida, Strain CCMP443" /LENGTH=217 /DNA_ID=CAMNT_0016175557 /DNA_START=14 /DNA_END=667 /DNA_ORIENTATION=+
MRWILVATALLAVVRGTGGVRGPQDGRKAYFMARDADGDGLLSEKECWDALEGTTLDPRLMSDEKEGLLRRFFEGQGEGSGMGFAEWKNFFDGDPPEAGDEGGDVPDDGLSGISTYHELTFRKHDKNGDGHLCREEAAMMQSGGRGHQDLSSEEHAGLRDMFLELDTDLSETISFDEWLSAGLSTLYAGLMGNTHAFQEYENVEDELDWQKPDLSFG